MLTNATKRFSSAISIAAMSTAVLGMTAGTIALSTATTGCSHTWIEDNPDFYPPYDSGAKTSSGSSGSRDGGPTDCEDPNGLGGFGCYRCEPQTNEQLLRACTTSFFETFDNMDRIRHFNPNAPHPQLVEQGPTPPPFDGGTSSGSDPTLPPAPPCSLATKPNPVMVLGATGFPFETIAKAMGNTATIYYLEKGSCDGVAAMLLNDPKLTGEVAYFEADGTKNRCVLAEPHPADLTISALFAETCANQSGLSDVVSLPSGVADFAGPVNPVMFTVPATSGERAISGEAAYMVYGFGSKSGVAPWEDESFIFRRRGTSGTQQTIALTLGLNPDELRGRDSNGATNMLAAMLSSSEPSKTIGITSSEIVDPNRDVMKSLAYRHFGQPVAFYPDSSASSYDRRNVRDGHYFMWMPLHVLARTNGGDPVAAPNATLDPTGAQRTARDAAVKRLAYVMVHRQEAPVKSVDLFTAIKKSGNVPQCAMHVKRQREGAPLEPFKPTVSCDCAFESATPGRSSEACTPCKGSVDCPSTRPVCNFGYCEPR